MSAISSSRSELDDIPTDSGGGELTETHGVDGSTPRAHAGPWPASLDIDGEPRKENPYPGGRSKSKNSASNSRDNRRSEAAVLDAVLRIIADSKGCRLDQAFEDLLDGAMRYHLGVARLARGVLEAARAPSRRTDDLSGPAAAAVAHWGYRLSRINQLRARAEGNTDSGSSNIGRGDGRERSAS